MKKSPRSSRDKLHPEAARTARSGGKVKKEERKSKASRAGSGPTRNVAAASSRNLETRFGRRGPDLDQESVLEPGEWTVEEGGHSLLVPARITRAGVGSSLPSSGSGATPTLAVDARVSNSPSYNPSLPGHGSVVPKQDQLVATRASRREEGGRGPPDEEEGHFCAGDIHNLEPNLSRARGEDHEGMGTPCSPSRQTPLAATSTAATMGCNIDMGAVASSAAPKVFPPQDRLPSSAFLDKKVSKQAPAAAEPELCLDPGLLPTLPFSGRTYSGGRVARRPTSYSHSSAPRCGAANRSHPLAERRDAQRRPIPADNVPAGLSEASPRALGDRRTGRDRADAMTSLSGSVGEDAITEDDGSSIFAIPNAEKVDGSNEQQLMEENEQHRQQLQDVPPALPSSAVIAEPLPPSSARREVPSAAAPVGPSSTLRNFFSDHKVSVVLLLVGVAVVLTVVITLAAMGHFDGSSRDEMGVSSSGIALETTTTIQPPPTNATAVIPPSPEPTTAPTSPTPTIMPSTPPPHSTNTPWSTPSPPFTTWEPDSLEFCEVAMLVAHDGSTNDDFGESVRVSTNTAVVGAPYDDDNGSLSGSVHMYVRTGSEWIHDEKLLPSDGDANDFFGESVSIDGDTIVVGAYGKNSDRGIAYIFVYNASSWTEQMKLLPDTRSKGAYFGSAVDISGDFVIVGAWGDENKRGSAYVFTRTGQMWAQQAKLEPDAGASSGAEFGGSVAIDNTTAVVGARWDDVNGTVNSGSAYVFVRVGSEWIQQAKLLAQDGLAWAYFGRSVDVLGDTIIVGAYGDGSQGSNSGSAYIFTRSGSDWKQAAKLLPDDGAEFDYFGRSVGLLSEDVAIVGAYGNDDKGSRSGSAYIFVRTADGKWAQKMKLLPGDGEAHDWFGRSVAADGGTVIVGTWGGEKAYIFKQC